MSGKPIERIFSPFWKITRIATKTDEERPSYEKSLIKKARDLIILHYRYDLLSNNFAKMKKKKLKVKRYYDANTTPLLIRQQMRYCIFL